MTRLHLPQTRTHHRNQQEVEGQEVQPSDSVVLREAVQLRPSAVVDVHVLLLSRSKHELIVQVPAGEGESATPLVGGAGNSLDVPDCLLDVELAAQLLGGPVECGEVSFASSNQQEPVGGGQPQLGGTGGGAHSVHTFRFWSSRQNRVQRCRASTQRTEGAGHSTKMAAHRARAPRKTS